MTESGLVHAALSMQPCPCRVSLEMWCLEMWCLEMWCLMRSHAGH